MTISELLQALREDFLDDTVEPFLWSTASLVRRINEAEREACRRADLIRETTLATAGDLYSGTTTATTAGKLVDSTAAFAATGVPGLTVYNLTDNTFTTVTARDSGTTLSLTDDIMASGDRYIIGDAAKALTRVCVVDGTAEYAISAKIRKIDACYFASDGLPLVQKTEGWLDDNYYQWRAAEGKPMFYVEHKGKIVLVPKPNESINSGTGKDTLIMAPFRLPLADMTYPAQTPASPEIPAEYHYDMLNHAADLAYQKQDTNTYNPNKSAFHAGKFTEKFGIPVSALLDQNLISHPALFTLQKQKF